MAGFQRCYLHRADNKGRNKTNKKMTKKKTEKAKSEKQEKFWVLSYATGKVAEGSTYGSLENAKEDAEEGDIINECVVTKTFIKKGWVEEK